MKIIIILTAIILAVVIYFNFANPIDRVCIEEKCFSVEIADSEDERATGLMYRESLDSNKGMLFVFEKSGIYGFWMQNTLIPLDIIWIDLKGKIVHIEHDVQPCEQEPCPTYSPEGEAKYVLEINANLSRDNGFEIGDQVIIR